MDFRKVLGTLARSFEEGEMDLSDIKESFRVRGGRIDWELLQGYFDMFGFGKLFGGLRRQYGKAD